MKSPLFPYDRAMYDRLHSLYDEVVFAAPEEAMKVNAKLHLGKVVLPFIALWRLPDFSINTDMYNDSFTRAGFNFLKTKNLVNRNDTSDRRVTMYGLPVTLSYQIDIYSTKRDVCDGLTSELLMEFKQRPYLNVQVHDMGETSIQFNLDLDESITDNTDISGFNESNRLYRLTITINLTEAVIYRVDDYKKVEKVYLDFRTILTDKGDYESMSESGIGDVIYEREEGSNIPEEP